MNDAGIDAPDGNVWDLPDEGWTRVIDVNLSGVFYCSKAALQPMLKAGQGAIVNISSQSARIGSKGMSPAYNTSKAGVLGLTMAFSAQVADKGVRVNAVTPGLVRSKEFGWSKEEDDGKTAEYPLGLGRTQGHRRGGQISGQPRVSMGLGYRSSHRRRISKRV